MKHPHNPPARQAASASTTDDPEFAELSLQLEEEPTGMPGSESGPEYRPTFHTRPQSRNQNVDRSQIDSTYEVRRMRRHPALLWDSGDEQLLLNEFQVTRADFAQYTDKFLFLVVDCSDSGGVGLMEIQAPRRYAHILARKRLEERGELNTEQELIIYAQRKCANGATELLYQAVPRAWYQALLQRCANHPQGMVCFDPVSLLRGLLMTLPRAQTHALAMRLKNAIVLLVGKGEQVLLARRYALYGEESRSLRDALHIIYQDIDLLAHTQERQATCIRWLEPMLLSLKWTLPRPSDQVYPVTPWPLVELRSKEQTCWSALPDLVSQLPLRTALACSSEAWLRPLEKAEPCLWGAMMLLTLVLCALAWSFNRTGQELRTQNIHLRQEAAALEQSLPRPPELPQQTTAILKLGERLALATSSPSLALLWNKLAASRPDEIAISAVNFHYEPDAVTLNLNGVIEGNLAESQDGLLRMASRLESSGFEVVQRTLNLVHARRNTLQLLLRYPFPQG